MSVYDRYIAQLYVRTAGADPGLTVGGAKYTALPTFDVISAHDMLYEEKVNK